MKFYLPGIFILWCCLHLQAQVPYTDYQNPYPQTDIGLKLGFDNAMEIDSYGLYINGQVAFPVQEQPLLFRMEAFGHQYKLYSSNPDTRFNSIVISPQLKKYYAFITTDATAACPSAGLKVLAINKHNLHASDSVYFCDPIKPTGGTGYYIYNHLYTFSSIYQYFPPPLPPNYSKRWNLIRRIDTNLVLKNEVWYNDTAETFDTYFLREAIDTGIILNAVSERFFCPMLIKLDTLGNEVWRKHYYTSSQTGGCGTTPPHGIMGLQAYQNGYIALFNANSSGICPPFYQRSIMAKMDRDGSLLKEVQYTSAGDTTLEFYSNFTNYTKRTRFYNILTKTVDGNFASVICDMERYGPNQHENYIAILDTNLNIIQRSPKLGSLMEFYDKGLVQGPDSTFYLAGAVRVNPNTTGMNTRIYTWKPGGIVNVNEYGSSKPGVSVYPNPATELVNIQLPPNTVYMLVVYNVTGQEVTRSQIENNHQLNVGSWPKGLYMAEFYDTQKQKQETVKFMVE